MPIVKNSSGHEKVHVSNFDEAIIHVDGLESLQGTTNTKLTSIDSRLDECIGHTNNTTEIGDGSNQLRSLMLGYDRSNNKARSLLVDSGGKLECSVSDLEVTMQNVNLNTDTLEAKIQSIDTRLDNSIGAVNNTTAIGEGSSQLRSVGLGYDRTNGKAVSFLVDAAGHQQVDIVSMPAASGAATEAKQDVIEASLTSMEGKMDVDNVVYDNQLTKLTEIDTAIDTIDGVLDSSLVKQGEIETSLNSLISANHTDLAALEASLTSMEGKMDVDNVVLDVHTGHLSEIEGAVETLEACVGSNKVNVNISSVGAGGISTEAKQDTIIGHVDGIETLITSTNSKIDTFDAVLDASLVKQTNIETLITTLDGVQDNVLTKLTGIDSDTDAIKTDMAAIEVLLTGIDADTNAIKVDAAAIEVLITSTNSKIDTFDAVLDASLVKQTNIETLITTLDGVQDSALVKLGEIETTNNANQVLLGTIDEDTNAIKVSAAALVVDAAANEVLLTSILAKNSEIEVTNNANQVLLGTIDSDTDAIKTSTAAIAVDAAANEVLLTSILAKNSEIEVTNNANQVLLGTIDADTNAMKVDLAALEVLQTSILAKLAPVKTSQVMLNGQAIGNSGEFVSAAIDATTAKHISFTGFSASVSGGADIKILGCPTTGGTYERTGISGQYYAGIAGVTDIKDCAFRFLKIQVNAGADGADDFSLIAHISS